MGFTKDWRKVKAPSMDRVRPGDLWEIYKIPKNLKPVRLIGPVAVMGEHWIEIKTKDGRKATIGFPCVNFDPETEAPSVPNGCPLCGAGYPIRLKYYVNAIIREEQKVKKVSKQVLKKSPDAEEYLTKELASYTPVKVVVVPLTVMRSIRELEDELNVYNGKVYPVNHPKYGRDVLLRFDDSKSGSEMYRVVLGNDRTPLTKIERRYKLWNLELIGELVKDKEALCKDMERALERAINIPNKRAKVEETPSLDIPEDAVLEPEEKSPKKSKKKAKKKKKASLEDRIYEMSRKELKLFIKKKGLPIKVKKSMSDDDIREAILDELGIV